MNYCIIEFAIAYLSKQTIGKSGTRKSFAYTFRRIYWCAQKTHTPQILSLSASKTFFLQIKFRFSEKATKFEKISRLYLTLFKYVISNVKKLGFFFKILWPSQIIWNLIKKRCNSYWSSKTYCIAELSENQSHFYRRS